jgi:hypothetical protein
LRRVGPDVRSLALHGAGDHDLSTITVIARAYRGAR